MPNKSSEILAKTIAAWSKDFSDCIRQKTDNLNRILVMFGADNSGISLASGEGDYSSEQGSIQVIFSAVQRAAVELEKLKGISAVRNLLLKFGADDLSTLEPVLYESFINDAEEMLNDPC